jgi:hypothetical protein
MKVTHLFASGAHWYNLFQNVSDRFRGHVPGLLFLTGKLLGWLY